ncbi:hypothetical protein [Treponema sp.]|uniref:hypothetical protein n=1 Tax=Treponema sp. TaxID=166 RepID=UPI00298D8B1E|nr:hypothetical protein [Treponema sp.]MCQ2241492.1 hypothetical protein [Treponema sp.]
MRKFLFLALVSLFLLGCNNQTIEKQSDSAITITINSDDGQTVMTVDEGTRNITSATYTSAETGVTVNKLYTYNNEELRSVAVSDPARGSYTISYEEETGVTRSLIAEETMAPRKVKKIHKTYNGTTRAAASYENSSPDIVEYQYDENGNLTSIFRIDDKNNIICKGEF